MPDRVALLAHVLTETRRLLGAVRPEQAALPTPCAEWDLGRLAAHVAGWSEVFAASAEGARPGPPDESVPLGEAEARFAAAAERAVAAFRAGATERGLTLMGGELPGDAVLGMMLMEYIGHGWDIAASTGQPAAYTDDEVAAAYAAGQAMLRPEYRGPQAIGHEVSVAPDATALARLLGFLGRDPAWAPAATGATRNG